MSKTKYRLNRVSASTLRKVQRLADHGYVLTRRQRRRERAMAIRDGGAL